MTASDTVIRLKEDENIITTRVESVPYKADVDSMDRCAFRLVRQVVGRRGFGDYTLKVVLRKDGSAFISKEGSDDNECVFIYPEQLADVVSILTDHLCYYAAEQSKETIAAIEVKRAQEADGHL